LPYAKRPVHVHHCIHADLDVGEPLDCRCRKHISLKAAESKVEKGEAIWKVAPFGVINHHQVILTGRRKNGPRASTIGKTHIERAFVRDVEAERCRIEAYGEMNQQALVALGATPRRVEPEFRESSCNGGQYER